MREHRAHETAPTGRRRAWGWLFVMLALAGGNIAARAAQPGTPPPLSGLWRLDETAGDLPEQAARALDGKAEAGASVTIQVDQTDADVTVRRVGNPPALLRVLPLSATDAIEHQVPGGGLLRARAEWRDQTLVANGQVAVKQGFLKRNVPFEEMWHLDEGGGTLTVTTTLKTPLGVKRRTQVFRRVADEAPGA